MSKRPVTLEDLLRLKRAERPPAEFWDQFDRQLRAKQLAALVEKRPWWRTLPEAFGRISLARYRLPLGATAALALTVVSWRAYNPVASPARATPEVVAADVMDHARAPVSISASRDQLIATTARSTENALADAAPAAYRVVEAASADSASPLAEVSAELPAGDRAVATLANAHQGGSSVLSDRNPGARFVAAELAMREIGDGAGARSLLSGATGFEGRALPLRASAEPLEQIASPAGNRRSRLAAALVSVASRAPDANTEKVARNLSDERLYDSIHRFGARGDRVLLKF